ncbi:hypothetical protein ACUY2E_10305 [Corynebacterium confusum]|nr:MAG TPA: hypothetical protein [Caudoviricetes sp.]
MNVIGTGITAPQPQAGGNVGDKFYVPINLVDMATGEKLDTAYVEGEVVDG